MDKDERILVIKSCDDCDRYSGAEWDDCPLRNRRKRDQQIHPDCPLERREPWLKLREVTKEQMFCYLRSAKSICERSKARPCSRCEAIKAAIRRLIRNGKGGKK